MNVPYSFRLREPVSALKIINDVWKFSKGWLISGGGDLEIEIRKSTRSSKQNRFLHAMLSDISKQIEWAGKKRDIETWKRLLVAAWCRATNEHVEILPAIDGHGVDIVFKKTSNLSRTECAELCEFIHSWCVENDVVLNESSQWIDQDTGEIFNSGQYA